MRRAALACEKDQKEEKVIGEEYRLYNFLSNFR